MASFLQETYQLNCHVFCSRFMQFLESVGLLAIFSSFPRRASHLSMKHNLNVECEIPPMVRLYSNEKHDILNQKINPKNWRRKKVFGQNISFTQSIGTSEDGIVKELFLNKGGGQSPRFLNFPKCVFFSPISDLFDKKGQRNSEKYHVKLAKIYAIKNFNDNFKQYDNRLRDISPLA